MNVVCKFEKFLKITLMPAHCNYNVAAMQCMAFCVKYSFCNISNEIKIEYVNTSLLTHTHTHTQIISH